MNSLYNLITTYKRLLQDFDIPMTPEMQHRIIEKYPDIEAIDHYLMKIICDLLELDVDE